MLAQCSPTPTLPNLLPMIAFQENPVNGPSVEISSDEKNSVDPINQ